MVGVSPLNKLMNRCRIVTAKARNVVQTDARSRRAFSLTLMTGTSAAKPPYTGVIAGPPAAFVPLSFRADRSSRNRYRSKVEPRDRSIQRWHWDREELARRIAPAFPS